MLEPVNRERNRPRRATTSVIESPPVINYCYYSLETDFDVQFCIDSFCSYLQAKKYLSGRLVHAIIETVIADNEIAVKLNVPILDTTQYNFILDVLNSESSSDNQKQSLASVERTSLPSSDASVSLRSDYVNFEGSTSSNLSSSPNSTLLHLKKMKPSKIYGDKKERFISCLSRLLYAFFVGNKDRNAVIVEIKNKKLGLLRYIDCINGISALTIESWFQAPMNPPIAPAPIAK